jgi:UDP-N-acetyl-D-glucosamine/UDP-N-acetyl-D-galactosamine dehydrogenase
MMHIDTLEVLDAAGTKWNFLPFKPGLVGGHCIGVDPYYLTHKAEQLGYIPQVILSGRRINDDMGKFIARRTIKEMIHANHNILGNTVTILGLTFKENCPDLRNSKVIEIIQELKSFGVDVQINDELAVPENALEQYGIKLISLEKLQPAAAVIIAVAHETYKNIEIRFLKRIMKKNAVLIDVKGILKHNSLKELNIRYWAL